MALLHLRATAKESIFRVGEDFQMVFSGVQMHVGIPKVAQNRTHKVKERWQPVSDQMST